jgi:DNA-binding transcriptional regulator YiaG
LSLFAPQSGAKRLENAETLLMMLASRHNPRMPNIASALKAEIARIARKEMRADIEPLRKASALHRSAIAALKREIAGLQKQIKRHSKSKPAASGSDAAQDGTQIRFSAGRLKNHRAKLGLSAKDYGALIGVSSLTIYKWEGGNTRPRAGQLPAIAAVRKLGKRQALVRLSETSAPKARGRKRS